MSTGVAYLFLNNIVLVKYARKEVLGMSNNTAAPLTEWPWS